MVVENKEDDVDRDRQVLLLKVIKEKMYFKSKTSRKSMEAAQTDISLSYVNISTRKDTIQSDLQDGADIGPISVLFTL